MNTVLSNLLSNARGWKTSLIGVSAAVALLSQNQAIMANQLIGHYVQVGATVVASLMLVFGLKDSEKPQA